MDILEEIVAHKRVEVARFKEQMPERELHNRVETMLECSVPSMREALMKSATGIISEFKRRSPSKAWIKKEGKAAEIPLSYQHHGAAAISILADEKYFGGSDAFITAARNSGVTVPILYKNFVVDEYQLFQARHCGASAVLLIAAALSLAECRSLLRTAREIGLEVLLEMHGERELVYAEMEPDMYGINNRNLGTFITDVDNSFRLARQLPEGACRVSESGISSVRTVNELRRAGFNGFLIGECFMREADPGAALGLFINNLSQC